MISPKRRTLLLLGLLIGFASVVLEVRVLHRDVLRHEWQGYIPLVYGLLAMFGCIVALSKDRAGQWLASAIFAIGIPVGLVGFWFHSDGKPLESMVELFGVQTSEAQAKSVEIGMATSGAGAGGDEDDEESHGSNEGPLSSPPPLAPTSLTGLAFLGLVLVWPGKRKLGEDEPEEAAQAI